MKQMKSLKIRREIKIKGELIMKPQKNYNNKPKNTITTYEKTFKSFNEMIKELRDLDENIAKILTTDSAAEQNTEADQTYCSSRDVYEAFSEMFPDIANRNNIHTSLTISSNRVIIKTDKFFTFGWKFKYNRDLEIYDITAVVTTFTRTGIKSEIDDKLKNDEAWTVPEK